MTEYIDEDGRYHRENGPAVERADGSKFWCIHGELHREDGPAVEREDGTKAWWIHDKLHREDGPAIIEPDGNNKWCIHDTPITTWKEYNELSSLSQEQQNKVEKKYKNTEYDIEK